MTSVCSYKEGIILFFLITPNCSDVLTPAVMRARSCIIREYPCLYSPYFMCADMRHEHTINIRSTYDQHTINIRSTYDQHTTVRGTQWTYNFLLLFLSVLGHQTSLLIVARFIQFTDPAASKTLKDLIKTTDNVRRKRAADGKKIKK